MSRFSERQDDAFRALTGGHRPIFDTIARIERRPAGPLAGVKCSVPCEPWAVPINWLAPAPDSANWTVWPGRVRTE